MDKGGFGQIMLYWQGQDRKTLKRINKLRSWILNAHHLEGIGKPDHLKENLSRLLVSPYRCIQTGWFMLSIIIK